MWQVLKGRGEGKANIHEPDSCMELRREDRWTRRGGHKKRRGTWDGKSDQVRREKSTQGTEVVQTSEKKMGGEASFFEDNNKT